MIVIGFFASQHALQAMKYCVIEHNVVPGFGQHKHLDFIGLMVVNLLVGAAIYALARNAALGARRAILFGTGAVFIALLQSYWPLVTAQGYLPVVPLILAAVIPSCFEILQKVPFLAFETMLGLALRAAFTISLGAILLKGDPLTKDELTSFNEGLAMLLKVSGPDDYVMDGKGETIFRHRPFYYVLEGVTRKRMKLHLIKDTIKEDCIAKNACVLVYNNRIGSHHMKDWIRSGYVEVAKRVWVAGVMLKKESPMEEQSFELSRSARYRVVSPEGPVTCRIDGVPYDGEVDLAPGRHQLVYEKSSPLAVVFARAVTAGLSPFTTQEAVFVINHRAQM